MTPTFQSDQLVGSWVHSHEEDKGDRVMYRPTSFAFPPSRGRTAMTLEKDGRAKFDRPGPVDRPVGSSGRWILKDNFLRMLGPDWSMVFEIIDVDPHELVLRKP